jgi:hypothetical protein
MSETDLELDRLRRVFASLEGRAPGASCPEPERLWSAAQGELRADVVRPLVLHLVECGACAEAWRLAREVEPQAGTRPPAVDARRAPVRPSQIAWGALAAGMTVALAASVVLRQPPGVPQYRAAEGTAIRSLVPEERPLRRGAFVLRWTPGPAGSRYSVQIATEALTALAGAGGLTVAEYTVSEAALRTVPAGARVLWRVETVLPDGSRAGSATFRTTVQ